MSYSTRTSVAEARTSVAVGDHVWDRVWRHAPSDEKDEALLAREMVSDRWRVVVDRLVARFGTLRGLRTIELGCGRGDLSILLAQRGADVTLLDCNDRALDAAKERFDRLGLAAQFEKGDLLSGFDAQRGRYDASLSAGVIEHFRGSDRTTVLRSHRTVLAPGGMTIISVPHSWCVPYRLWKAYLGIRGWWPYGMEIPYSRLEIAKRAAAAGFQHVETHGLHLLRSIGDHWVKRLAHKSPYWVDRSCALDPWMGSILLMFGWMDPPTSAAGLTTPSETSREG